MARRTRIQIRVDLRSAGSRVRPSLPPRSWLRAEEKPATRDEAAETLLLLEAPGNDDDRAELPENEVAAETDRAMEIATRRSLIVGHAPELLLQQEKAILAEMTEVADAGRGLADPRIRILVNWIEQNLCPGWKGWNDCRVLIFTEYRHEAVSGATTPRRYRESRSREQANRHFSRRHGGYHAPGVEASVQWLTRKVPGSDSHCY